MVKISPEVEAATRGRVLVDYGKHLSKEDAEKVAELAVEQVKAGRRTPAELGVSQSDVIAQRKKWIFSYFTQDRFGQIDV